MVMATAVAGQNSTLIQNINFRADELKHNLNMTGDTILLKGSRNIAKVDIYNDDFNTSFNVDNTNASIPLIDIPIGRYVTEVHVEEKRIIITLLRHNTIEVNAEPLVALSNAAHMKNDLEVANLAKETVLTTSKERVIHHNAGKKVRMYWIVNIINMGQSSRKIMKMGDLKTVKNLIRKHEIDHRTKYGQLNDLTIWEVYDTSKFMRYKRQNRDYAKTESSEFFNTRPFYQLLGKESIN